MRGAGESIELRVGDLLRRLVDHVSHRSGAVLTLMADAGITLPQLLLLARVAAQGSALPSRLAARAGASLPATSQMLERLAAQGLLARGQDSADRRRRTVTVTPRGRRVLDQVSAARAVEYAQGLAAVPPSLLRRLAESLEPVLAQAEVAEHPVPAGGRQRPPIRRTDRSP